MPSRVSVALLNDHSFPRRRQYMQEQLFGSPPSSKSVEKSTQRSGVNGTMSTAPVAFVLIGPMLPIDRAGPVIIRRWTSASPGSAPR